MHQPTELRQVNWFQLDKFKLTDDLLMQKCSKLDVLKLNGLCVVAVRYAADSVRPHPFIRDTVLRIKQLANCRSETDKTPVWDEKEGT